MNQESQMENAVIISTTPEQETQALIVSETDKLIETTLVELKKSTITDDAIAHLQAEYSALAISDINDLQGYNAVKSGAAKVKKIRTAVEAKRKELKEPALRFGKALDAEADRIKNLLTPIEDELNRKKKDYEDAVEASKRAEYQRRVQLLTDNAYQLINGFFVCGPVQLHSDELSKITEAQLEVYLKQGQEELARRAAEEQRRREEAERQRQEQERLAAERAEIERMRAELEAEKQRVAQEIAAQTQAIENTYETVVQPVKPAPSIEFGQPIHHAEPMPIQNTQAIPQASVPHENQISHLSPSDEFERGFNAFRVQLTALVNDENVKLSRAYLREWAWSAPFPKH